jgi:hypothetical protein
MAVQLSTSVRNARLNAIESTISTSAVLKGWTGSQPATCATADSGTLLFSITLPSDWMAAASSGAISMLGAWEDASANATGTAAHFRIYESTATTCHMQGTITATDGGGDMTIASTSITAGQVVEVTSFSITDGNA